MGQYHTIANRTKKEFFSIGGAKLLEKSYNPMCSTALMVLLANSNGRGGGDLYVSRDYDKDCKPLPLSDSAARIDAAVSSISGRWSGDSIVIQGDYAETTDTAFIPNSEFEGYTDITEQVLTALEADSELRASVAKERDMQAQVSKFHAKVNSNVVELKPKAKEAKPKKRRSKLQPWQIGG